MKFQQPQPPSQPSVSPEYVHPILSSFIPCSGQFLKGHSTGGFRNLAIGISLGLLSWQVATLYGKAAGILFAILSVLPWWCMQAYEASFSKPHTFFQTLTRIWQYSHDIHFLGGLFLLTGIMDLYIILGFPEYALTIFCTKPSGIPGILAKVQSPILHLVIGYGFLRLTRWSLWVYFVYAGFGLLNATANFACLGYGRIRSIFLLTLLLFTCYIFVRRNRFLQSPS